MPNIHLGHDQLLKLLREDFNHFSNIIFVLDGDVAQNKIDEVCKYQKVPNVIKLPGEKSPEEMIFEYLVNTDGGHELYKQLAEVAVSKRSIIEHGPESMTQFEDKRYQYKQWFNQLLPIIEQIVYPFWENEYKELVNSFRAKFIIVFNEIDKRIRTP